MNTCRKLVDKEERYFDVIYRMISQYLKCLLIIGSILFLIYIRRGISKELTVGKLIAYILLSSLICLFIYMCDNLAFNNIIIGLAIYFGFELLKFN